jgi:hypothetical protein
VFIVIRKYCILFIILIIAVLMVIPITRGLILDQIRKPSPAVTSDYLVQLSRLCKAIDPVDNSVPPISIDHLRRFAILHPSRPEGFAMLLVCEQRDFLPSAARANAFLADADAALKIDPINGFFYAEKAMGYGWIGRMDLMVHYVQAATKSAKWDDYIYELYCGMAKDEQLPYGYQNAIDNNSNYWRCHDIVDDGNFKTYRYVSQKIVDAAIVAERAGDIDRGWALRKTVREFGLRLLRRSNQSRVSAFTATSVITISMGGLLSSEDLDHTAAALWKAHRYDVFLAQQGRVAQAREIANVRAYNKRAHDALDSVHDENDCMAPSPFNRFVVENAFAILLIYGTIFACMLWILGQIALLPFAWKRLKRVHAAIIAAVTLVLEIGAVIAAILCFDFNYLELFMNFIDDNPTWALILVDLPHAVADKLMLIMNALQYTAPRSFLIGCLVAALISMIFSGLAARAKKRPVIRAVVKIALIALAVSLLLGVLGMASSSKYVINAWIGIVFTIQLIAAGTTSYKAWASRQSLALAFASSLRTSSYVCGAAFVIGYACLAPSMAANNAAANRLIDQLAKGEVAYAMRYHHFVWPPK